MEPTNQEESVCSIVRAAENNYIRGTTHLSPYVDFSMYDTVNRIDAYINSVHISGSQDSLGREKPFFNIVTAAVNIWYRATDLDRKDIRIRAGKKRDQVKALLATIHIKEWMKKAEFGKFLNKWGRTLATYGSAVVKFVEKDGVLIADIIPWSRMIVDAVDFGANVRIEKLYMTPAQLKAHKLYDQKIVKDLIANASGVRETQDGQRQDNLSGYIEIYEVHGELPLELLTDKESDSDVYRQQMHVISFIETKDGEYADYCLYKGKEAKDPYMITHLIEEDGRTLARGAVELLFDAQWMQNHAMKNMKDTLDIASKLVFQTADTFYVGRNILSALETGDILIHKPDMPLTQANTSKGDVTSLQNFATQWRMLEKEITSTPDVQRGFNPATATLGATQIMNQNSYSLFEIMTENKGLYIDEMLRTYIIPHIKKGLDNADEIAATLEDHDLTQIDSIYMPYAAVKSYNDRTTQQMFKNIGELVKGNTPPPLDQFNPQMEQQSVMQGMASQGNTRYFTPDDIKKLTWKEYFKDFEWDADVEVTNESIDKQQVLTALSSMLQTAVNNPELYKLITSKIADETGVISPVQMSVVNAKQSMQPPMSPAASG